MVRRRLVASLSIGLGLALAAGGNAAGSVTALVEQETYAPGRVTDVHVEYSQPAGSFLPYGITIYVPAGYELGLDVAPGDPFVTNAWLTVDVTAGKLTVVEGVVSPVAVDAVAHGTLAAQAAACTGTASHALELRLTISLEELIGALPPLWRSLIQAGAIPETLVGFAFGDPASEADAALGHGYRIAICLPLFEPVAAGTKLETELRKLEFDFAGVVTNPARLAVRTPWSTLFLPWNPARTGVNALAVAETRAVVGLSPELAFARLGSGKVKPKSRVQLAGTLLPEGPAGSRTITIWAGPTAAALAPVATVTASAGGAFRYTATAPAKGRIVFQATTGALGVDATATACGTPHPDADGGCTATLGGLASGLVKVAVKR